MVYYTVRKERYNNSQDIVMNFRPYTSCGCADENYMTPPTLGLVINIKYAHFLNVASVQDRERRATVRRPDKGVPDRTEKAHTG